MPWARSAFDTAYLRFPLTNFSNADLYKTRRKDFMMMNMDIDDLWGSNECHGLGNSREINLSFKAMGLAAIGIIVSSYKSQALQMQSLGVQSTVHLTLINSMLFGRVLKRTFLSKSRLHLKCMLDQTLVTTLRCV